MSDFLPLTADELVGYYSQLGVARGCKLAVAVSGGIDSLSLLLLTAQSYDVTAITVDHGLRAEAAEEARYVAKLCLNRDIPHITLKWDDEKPTANIQAVAREARYGLLQRWCEENGISTIATAHHMDDQAETVLLRLARGSGVYGLAGMAPTRPLGDHVILVRPLLSVPKGRLTQVLQQLGVTWVEDPSNVSEAYDRVKIRQMLANPPVEGLNASRLAGTAERLRRSRTALEYYEKKWLAEAVTLHDAGYCTLETAAFSAAPEEIVLRGLASICRYIGRGMYVPRMEKLLRLYQALQETGFRGQTLYGALFSAEDAGRILITRELSKAEGPVALAPAGRWDNRYTYTAKGNIKGLMLAVLGQNGWVQLKHALPSCTECGIPRQAIMALPAIFVGDELRSVPFLEYNNGDSTEFRFSLIRMT